MALKNIFQYKDTINFFLEKIRFSIKHKRLRKRSYVVLPFLFLLTSSYVQKNNDRYVLIDNAYLKADKIAISSDLSCRVQKVFVNENQYVKSGDILFQLEDTAFRLAVQRLEAQLKTITNEIESKKANFHAKEATVKQAQKDVIFYKNEFDRQTILASKKNTTETKRGETQNNYEKAQNQLNQLKYELDHSLALLSGNPDIKVEEHPSYLEIKADYDKAILDLKKTSVYAPRSGVITHMTLVAGDYVTVGIPIFSLVLNDNVWVEANIKETELSQIAPEQKARVIIDAYPNVEWNAIIEGISPISGSESSATPFQNATGNWIKTVQRIPVKLRLKKMENQPILRAGLSACVEVDTQSP